MMQNSPVACARAVRTAAPLPRLRSCRTSRITPGARAAIASTISTEPSVEPSSTTTISRLIPASSGAASTLSSRGAMNSSSLYSGTRIESLEAHMQRFLHSTVPDRGSLPVGYPDGMQKHRLTGLLALALSGACPAAELRQPTIDAFDGYIRTQEQRIDAQVHGPENGFLWSAASPERLRQLQAGGIAVESRTSSASLPVRDSTAIPPARSWRERSGDAADHKNPFSGPCTCASMRCSCVRM